MIIDGKKIAQEIHDEIASSMKGKRPPGIAFILVGHDVGSQAYVHMKKRRCEEIGFHSKVLELSEKISTEELIEVLSRLNDEKEIDGILVQQPLPTHIDTEKVVMAIHPEKDVDGFHPQNFGKLLRGDRDGFICCTPLGIVELLKRSKIQVAGKHVVIIGRSNIVGKPLAALLMQKHSSANATVTIAHSHTENLPSITRQADILISAMGYAGAITKEHVKEGAIVIDVGVNRIKDPTGHTRLVGDVDFESVKEVASKITPVPGGVGPMTIAMLLQNTFKSYISRS